MASRIPTTDRRRSAGRGFTLAEALVASVFLALGVLGVSTALLASSQSAKATRQLTIALGLGRQMMEETASRPLDSAAALSDGGTAATPNLSNDYAGVVESVDATASGADAYGRTTSVAFFTRPIAPVLMPGPTPAIVPVFTNTPGKDFAIVTVTVTTPGGGKVSVARLVSRLNVE